jgi:hypothetical protein
MVDVSLSCDWNVMFGDGSKEQMECSGLLYLPQTQVIFSAMTRCGHRGEPQHSPNRANASSDYYDFIGRMLQYARRPMVSLFLNAVPNPSCDALCSDPTIRE